MKKRIILLLILLLFPFSVFAEEISDLYSETAVLYNRDTHEILYDKNGNDKTLIASLTKVMTSIVAIENIKDMNEKVVLNDEIFDYLSYDLSTAGFKRNEEVTYEDLLYGALFPSGADATHSLAYFISGSEEEYIKLMNKKAKELGMTNTHFVNTIGIEDVNDTHYSSAEDMVKLLDYALKNDTFREMFSNDKYVTSDKSLTFVSPQKRTSERLNIDLSIISGSKTGYTSRAGLCLASYASNGKANLILVTTGAHTDRQGAHYLDAKKIYEYYFDNYEYKTLLKEKDEIVNLKTKYEYNVSIKQDKDVRKYLKKEITKKNLKYIYKGKKVLDNTVRKGDKLGTYYIKYKDEVLFKKTIYAPYNIKYRLNKIQKNILKIIIVFSALTEYITIKRRRRLRKRRRKRHKKH